MKLSSCEHRHQTSVAAALSASTFVAELIADCPAGMPLDAHAVLAEHPELLNHKSALLELAYEDFCRRDDLGIPVEPGDFASGFPTISRSLLHQIEVHRLLADGPAGKSPSGEPQWPAPGQTWLDFQLLQELGRGAYSRVYLAREKSLGDRLVVVKATALGPQEAHTLGMLQHPHIVPVHSTQRDEQLGLTAVCMPFLSRVSLFDVMDALFSTPRAASSAIAMLDAVRRINAVAGAEPEAAVESAWPRGWSHSEAVAHIGIQLAQALLHAHRQGVLHGDVKPSNVLLTNSGRAVLLDFNLATFGDESVPFIAGTLPYMAPEQLRPLTSRKGARDSALNERADIFSLGLTLWELLTGRPPFGPLPAETSRERFAAQLLERYRKGPVAASGRNARFDRSIENVLRTCLEFDPARRPKSMDELAASLGAQLRPIPRLRRWLSRYRRLTMSAAALTCAALLAVSGWQLTREPYTIREWRKGEAAYRQNRYADAIVHLTHTLEQDPQADEARLLRAIARIRLHDFAGAHDDLTPLCKQPSDGRARAALAHLIVLREERYEAAAAAYRQAVAEGYRSPLIYCNLGHCLSQHGGLSEAQTNLKMAISLDPHMGAAYHNLSRIELRLGLRSGNVPETAAIDEALRLGPESSELYLDAACLHALRARLTEDEQERNRSIDRVFEFLTIGLDRGLTAKHVDEVAGLNKMLRNDVRWSRLDTRLRPDKPFTRAVLMFDPLSELSSFSGAAAPVIARR
jgi:serine/threonine protein kinase/Tfp pilus assembly protein PilF